MKKLLIFIAVPMFLISCSGRTGEFSNAYLLEQYGSFRIPVSRQISEPVFDSENSFWTAAAEDRRILYRSDLEGNMLDQITLYLYPAALNIDHFEMGPDSGSALMTVSYDNTPFRDICKLTFASSDHRLFQLDGSDSFLIPNPLSLSITALSEPWGNQVAYLGTQFDYGTSTATQRVYIYDYQAGSTLAVDLDPGTYTLQDGNLTGNYFYRIDAFPDDEFPDEIHSFLICQRIEGAESDTHSFKIIKSDGTVDFDAAGTYEYRKIGGIRWLSREEVLMTVMKEDRWQILAVNSEGVERVLYQADKDVHSLQGLSISPQKDLCMTKIYYGESDSYSEILIVGIP